MIYLDSAATALHRPPAVGQAIVDALACFGSPGRGAHAPALQAARTVYQCRTALADLFGVEDPARVCFTRNATEALNTAIFGLFTPEDHVITTDLEHNSVLRPLYLLRDAGMGLTILPADRQGCLDMRAFARALRPNTRGVVCTHASNVTGNVVDVAWVGEFCRSHGLHLIVDGAQSAGVLDVDMKQMGISVFCFTGHKGLLGPQGTGGLCVAPGVHIQPHTVGGSGIHSFDEVHPNVLPTALEAGTCNAHGIAGLLAGINFIKQTDISAIRARELALAERFYACVRAMPGVTVYGDWHTGAPRTAVVTLNVKGEDAAAVADALAQDYGVCTRAGAHCAPRMHRALGTESAVRVSFSYFNTEAEVDAAAAALAALLKTEG